MGSSVFFKRVDAVPLSTARSGGRVVGFRTNAAVSAFSGMMLIRTSAACGSSAERKTGGGDRTSSGETACMIREGGGRHRQSYNT